MPVTTANKITQIKLPQDLYTLVRKRAGASLRSINNEMVVLIKTGLASKSAEREALSVADQIISQEQEREREKLFQQIERIQQSSPNANPNEVMQDVLEAQQTIRATAANQQAP